MKKLQHISLIIIIAAIFCSCRIYYAPNAHNVPLFQEEKEARLSASYCRGELIRGFDFQGAYALKKNHAIMANGFFVSDGFTNINLFELGYGKYKPFPNRGVAEIYGGIGWGSNKTEEEPTLNYLRYFVQPSVGFTSNAFDIAVSTRFCGLQFYNYKRLKDESDTEVLRKISFLYEPAVTMRTGWKYVKLQCQVGYSLNVNNRDLLQDRLNANIGLYISITDKFKNKRNRNRYN